MSSVEDERFVANMDSCEAWSDEEEQLEPPDALYEFPVTEENGVIEAYTLNGDTVKNSKYLPMPAASTRAPFANPLLSKKLQRWHLNKLNPSLLQKNETGASAFYTSSSITPDSKIFSRNVVNSNSRSSSIFAGTEEDRKVSSIAGGRPSVVVYQNKLYAAGDVSDDSTSDSDNEELESDGGVEKAVKSSCGGVNLAGDMAGCGYSESLAFDAEFEGGNVDKVCRVFDRGDFPDFASVPPKASAAGSRARDSRDCPMVKLDQEYDLSLRKDIYTAGNMQWFHFSVSTSEIVKNASDMGVRLDNYRDSGSRVRHYPFTVRFNIINFLKKDSLFNYGMKISTYSHKNASEAGKAPGVKQRGSPQAYGSTSNSTLVAFDQVTDEVESVNHESWTHGGENICYYRNGQCITRKKRNGGNVVLKKRALYTLTFTYTFTGPDCVHFAYCCPYTYTDLQLYLQKLERNEQVKVIMRRQKLCDTLMGNRCDLLTICEPTLVPDKPQTPRPAIVVTGRIHPGEANASHAMQGFIDFITSPDNVQAYLLRKMFVFKIVPMLNPGILFLVYRVSQMAAFLFLIAPF